MLTKKITKMETLLQQFSNSRISKWDLDSCSKPEDLGLDNLFEMLHQYDQNKIAFYNSKAPNFEYHEYISPYDIENLDPKLLESYNDYYEDDSEISEDDDDEDYITDEYY